MLWLKNSRPSHLVRNAYLLSTFTYCVLRKCNIALKKFIVPIIVLRIL